jgi:hypothetical protein
MKMKTQKMKTGMKKRTLKKRNGEKTRWKTNTFVFFLWPSFLSVCTIVSFTLIIYLPSLPSRWDKNDQNCSNRCR